MFRTKTHRSQRGTKEDGGWGRGERLGDVGACPGSAASRRSSGRAGRGALEARSDGRGLRPTGAEVGVVNNQSDERREEHGTRPSLQTSPTK